MQQICEKINQELIPDSKRFEDTLDKALDDEKETAAEELAHVYQALMHTVDETIEEIEDKVNIAPSCLKGCAHCCYFPILVTPMEAKFMIQFIKKLPDEKKDMILAHLNAYFNTYHDQLNDLRDLTFDHEQDKHAYKSKHLPCPMLDTSSNTCLAYDVRPIPCRTYLNYSDPIVCSQIEMPKEPLSYAFLGEFTMEALHEYIQELWMDGEDESTLGIHYPDDAWRMLPLPYLLEELIGKE